ncbi:MAG: SRPBCC family protein [Gemmatimonadota bacterium]|nr:MAG: SRPBCC family protein [Gemmatimonadota bacterium]
MTSFSGEIRINAPKEKVWEVIADLGGIQAYHPGVRKSYYTSEQREGVGASRHCDLKPFGSLDERIVSWQDGDSYVIDIYNGEKVPPFKTATGYVSVEQDGTQTIARFAFQYELKLGPLGWLMDRIMVRSRLKSVVPAALRGLKRYVENGESEARRREPQEQAQMV